MENNQDTKALCLPSVVLDTVAEQLADVDLTLPDYCPDIEKILKCKLCPKLQSKSLSGGQLQIDGYCVVTVLYVEGEKKTIRCCEQTVSFSQSFTLRETPDDPVIITSTKPEYINCRALSPRRLVMHGAFSLYAKVLGCSRTALYSPDDEQLEARTAKVRCANLKSLCQEQFSVYEEISTADKPPVEALLYTSLDASVTDSKAVTGKLMINGELDLRLFYLSDIQTGETAKLDYILPFSQIIDCEGIDEETVNLISVELMSYDVRLKNDMLSDSPSLSVEAKLCITEQGYILSDEEIVTDAYSVKNASSPCFEQLSLTEAAAPVSESFIEKLSVKVDDGRLLKILDIFPDSVTADCAAFSGGINVSGKINMCLLALGENNVPVFIERSFEYTHALASAADLNTLIYPKARASSVSYRLADDNTAELRCELRFTAGALKNESIRAVSDIDIFEDKPITGDSCALTLYFASRGESLWDIAKAHNTRLERLISENSADSITLGEPQMLLIPGI